MFKLVMLTVFVVFFCACTPKTAGQDSAYLLKNRGAPGAQISREQAEQYSRQQMLAANEIELENMKRRQTTDAVREASCAVNSATNATRNVKNLFG